MGAACCVAAKDRSIVNGARGETLHRHVRSPSWSFRWENRGRVAGEEIPANWSIGGGNDQVEAKSSTTLETAFNSEEGSPLDSSRSLLWRKSPVSEGNAGALLRLPVSDQTVPQNLVEVKESTESSHVSQPSPVKLSTSAPSVSSILPPNSTPSRRRHLSRTSENKPPSFSIYEEASLSLPNESSRGSNGGSSDSWSIPIFSDLTPTRKERWSFDTENSSFGREKSSERSSGFSSMDLQTCGVCTKPLIERSLWGQKIISTNELAVVSVLTCGHVYHAECLEYTTPEVNKYDPPCPICTYGEKHAAYISEKAMKAEMDLKARKRSKKRVVDSDLQSKIACDHHKCVRGEEKGPKTSSRTSMKSSLGKPFLKRHFSFSSKASRSLGESQSARRKGFFLGKI
ncbi:hypothetical protein ABFS83_14G114800 [Erythranthe nasuta]